MGRFTVILIAAAMVCVAGISTQAYATGSRAYAAEALAYAKSLDGVEGSTLCKADLDAAAVGRFQELIKAMGHDLKVLEGTALATADQVKAKTFTVFLKCVDEGGMVYVVTVCYVKDNLAGIKVKPTGERSLRS
jgi:glycyl-tRNA synthetase beta subunit